MSTVFNQANTDLLNQPMFFGDSPNIARYDVQKYSIFEKLTDTQHSFFWRPEEVDLTKDQRDYKTLEAHEKHIFLSNLKYQILLDSVQGRSPFIALMPFISLPELEVCVGAWGFFEQIHSRSYTHIIRNIVHNPSEIFDTILDDEKIIERARSVTAYYDDFINYSQHYKLFGYGQHTVNSSRDGNVIDSVVKITITERELKKKLYLALMSIYILEGIRFYVSFACSFAFAELDKMEGNAKIISLIARDEFQHLAIVQNILKNYRLKEQDQEMIMIMDECEHEVYAMIDAAVTQEKEWGEYLFKDGSIIGLNEKLLSSYVEFIANQRLKSIGLKQQYHQPTNPLSWTDNWLQSKKKQVAPQETEINSYIVGGIDMAVKDDEFKDFSL